MPGHHGQESRLAQNLAIVAIYCLSPWARIQVSSKPGYCGNLLFVKGQKKHMSNCKSKQTENIGTIPQERAKRKYLAWKETNYYLVVKTSGIHNECQ